jgi:hypothetical protein
MKGHRTIILLLIISLNLNLSAQDFTKLNEIKLSDSLSCSQAQSKVIECCNYLLMNPCVENLQDANAIKFIVDWMGATPNFSFSIDDNFQDIIKSNIYLSGRYYASLAKIAIEKNYTENSMALQLEAITAVLDYCELSQNKVKITNKIQKYIDAKQAKSLKEFILNSGNLISDQTNIDENYIEILRNHSQYSNTDYSSIPDFTYESDSCSDLVKLREKYTLDSIAGSGDEFEKQKNLLKWVNRFIKHNAKLPLPTLANTDTLFKTGLKDGANCGGLAILLNSVYLSMGYKSRFITCLNNDTVFNDPHSLTIVFSSNFNKWILMDPTYCAFFSDEKSIPLSIEEIRDRFINGLKIKLNDDFNLNSISISKSTNEINHYYNYIARNMFRFIAPVQSKFEFNSNCSECIYLIPKDFKLNNFLLGKEIQEGCEKYYCIDNQKQFWK